MKDEPNGRKWVYRAKLTERKEIARDAFEYSFRTSRAMAYTPGQYVWIVLDESTVDDPHGARRAFSIACAPRDKKTITIVFRKTDSGYNRALRALSVGATIEILGPFGSAFTVDVEGDEHVAVIAGGTGVSPFKSIVEARAAARAGALRITMFYLAHGLDGAPYHDVLKAYADEHPWFTFVPLIGRDLQPTDLTPELSGEISRWYVSGPQEMIDWVYPILERTGVPRHQCAFEHHYPKPSVSMRDLFTDLRTFGADAMETFSERRHQLTHKYLPLFVLVAAGFAIVSSVSLSMNNHPWILHFSAGLIFLGIFALWFLLKTMRDILVRVGVVYAGGVLFASLVLPEYAHHITFWLPLFPLAAFLFLPLYGRYAVVLYVGAVSIFSVLVAIGFVESSLTGFELLQAALGLSFIAILAGYYEYIVRMAGKESDRYSRINRIFRDTINDATNHMVVTDTNGVVWFANKAATDATGFSMNEIIGGTPRLWGGMESPVFYEDLWKKKAAGGVFVGEIRNRRKNNEEYIAFAHISPIKDSSGDIIGYLGTEEDITPIKQSEERARKSEERFVELTSKIQEVYWIIDLEPRMHIAYVSPAYETIWEQPVGNVLADPLTWIEYVHKNDQKGVRKAFDDLVARGVPLDMEYRLVTNEGHVRFVHDKREAIMGRGRRAKRIVGVTRDITKEKESERAKSEFITIASHQLRTPLTGIRWLADNLIKKEKNMTKIQKEYLHDIRDAGGALAGLVEQLLNVSRIEEGAVGVSTRDADVVGLVHDVVQEFDPAAKKKNITLLFDDHLESLLVQTGPQALRNIIHSLIANAVEYTPASGTITVSVKKEGSSFVVAVADTGIGIPADEQRKLFEKFVRASNAIKVKPSGTGLGLYVAKEAATLLGGDIRVRSEEGAGSTFTVTLPLKSPEVKGSKEFA